MQHLFRRGHRSAAAFSRDSRAGRRRRFQREATSLWRGDRRSVLFTLACLLSLCGALLSLPLQGQDASPEDLRAKLEQMRESVQSTDALEAEAREALLSRLRAAESSLDVADREQALLDELQASIANADATVQDFTTRTRDIEKAPADMQRRLGDNAGLAAIEAELGFAESQRNAWNQERKTALDDLAALAEDDRRRRERIDELTAESAAMSSETSAAPDGSLEAAVDGLADRAEQLARQSEEQRLRLELREGPTLNKIRTARIAWLDAAIAENDELLGQLRDAAAANRQSAAAQRRAEIRRTLARLDDVPPVLQALVDVNLEKVSAVQKLALRIDAEQRALSITRELAEQIEQDANLTQRRLDVAGLEARLGEVMLTRLASLPDPRTIIAQTRARNEDITELSIAAIDTEQAIRELSDRGHSLGDELDPSELQTDLQRQAASELHQQRRDLLQSKLQAENSLLRLLVDHNQATENLAATTSEYKDLLTGQLLWVRSYSFADPGHIRRKAETLLSASPLQELLDNWPRLTGNPLTLILILILTALTLRRRAIRTALNDILGKPIRPRDESNILIIRSLLLTLLRVLRLPLLFILLGHSCLVVADGDLLLTALHDAFLYTGYALLFWRYFAVLGSRLGAGRRMLKWNNQTVDAAARDLRWAQPLLALALFACVFGNAVSPTNSGGALAAGGSLLIALVLFLMTLRILRSGQFASDTLKLLCLRASALLFAAIIVMHLSGQLFAAHLYLIATAWSIAAVLSTLFVTNVLRRMLLIYRARLERERREEQRARDAARLEADADEVAAEDTQDAVSSLSEAYSKLLVLFRSLAIAALLWIIWSPALPALSIFESVTLWTVADNALPAGELRSVTLATVLIALIVIAVTLLLTRHFPPLLNVMLMEWTAVTPGGRYATGMLLQYLIIGIGFSAALVMLGFQWSKVQWLVAALGVGIGFGLQEIVANFISGLIVLFERPIRVGDIINAGGTDGTVTRINPRATVIETFEGKEVMLPNKELITNVVTNWSLSSTRLRVVVPVGIAYGSDVAEAMRILVRIAKAHPEILAEPEPVVTFEDFGDNALVLWLRCYAMQDYLRIKTELRQRIYDAYNEAGIGIAFPQRDVHLDAASPIPVTLVEKPDS